jgi:hypothetical protein
VYLVGFIIKKFVTMRGHMNVKCVTLLSDSTLYLPLTRFLNGNPFSRKRRDDKSKRTVMLTYTRTAYKNHMLVQFACKSGLRS